MPDALPPGTIKNGYEIVKAVNRGAFAIAYEAKTATNESVFFKQYRLPNPEIAWFNGFVNHQLEIKKTIEEDLNTRNRCYRFIEFFVDYEFYQVFEFIENGLFLAEFFDNPKELSLSKRLYFAEMLMSGIKALHDLKIIHSDLKPDNIFLVKDNKEDRYKLKIIDVDWAFFSDKQAPWHGTQGYVGTFGYMSPEHIDGKTPSQASDIFTCGIILGQLLTGQHPFHESLDETYNHSAFKGRFSPIMLSSTSNSNEVTVLETLLNLCLDPKPDNRPSAGQVHAALVCVRKNLTY